MFLFETSLFLGIIVFVGLLWLFVVFFMLLFKYRGITVLATIMRVDEKEKYYDDTSNKRIAYEYEFQYVDYNMCIHRGILKKNTSHKEFVVGDKVEIIYIKCFPQKPIYKRYYESFFILPCVLFIVFISLLFFYL